MDFDHFGQGQLPPLTLRMTPEVFEQIQETIGRRPAETGGILGGARESCEVTHFHFDDTPLSQGGASYTPNTKRLNQVIKHQWKPQGIDFLGSVHSHPPYLPYLSAGDEIYIRRILTDMQLPYLLVPIVLSIADTNVFAFFAYAAIKTARGGIAYIGQELFVGEREYGRFEQRAPVFTKTKAIQRGYPRARVTPTAVFAKVTRAYDLAWLARARAVVVGVGGSASFVEDLARAGVMEFVLIDPDIVEATNIATQQAYADDIGRPKVEAVAMRLSLINPEVRVSIYQQRLEELSDEEFLEIALSPFLSERGYGKRAVGTQKPQITLLCGMTDDFFTQARVNRLSLKFSLPSLCCQLYREGRAGEVTFTYPGVTPACHRCMLINRYQAYLERGYRNDVTSEGAPIFATSRINALCGMIALALLHQGTNHPRFGDMLRRIGNRTLVQLRLHPDSGLSVFDNVFSGADRERVFFDEPVWLPQLPEPTCPDCGGTGDLLRAMSIACDTRDLSGQTGSDLPAGKLPSAPALSIKEAL